MTVMTLRLVRAVVTAAAAAGLVAPAAAAQVMPWDPGQRLTVEGTVPAWATPQARVGDVDDGQQRHVQVALALRDPRGAEEVARAVSTPGSPRYQQFLTGQEFLDRFGPTEHTVKQVAAWLREEGLTVNGMAGNRRFVEATGSVDQLQRAFGVRLGAFRHVSEGVARTLTAPESPVSVPEGLRPGVSAVLGLDDSEQLIRPQQATLQPRVQPAAPGENCAEYWGQTNNGDVPQKYGDGSQSTVLCGYTGPQTRAAYGLAPTATGAGSTVGIVGAYNLESVQADTNRAALRFGTVPLAPGQYNAVLPDSFSDQDQCAPESWASEQALDVQAVHAIAPAAGITYYGAKSCLHLFDALNQAVIDNTASVITNSWLVPGESSVPPATRDQLGAIAVQAAVQGQSVLFSSGDSGDNSAVGGRPEASFPASSPWVTAVGGTTVALDAANRVRFATGWENAGNTQQGTQWVPHSDQDGPMAGGAGGGVSTVYDAPEYQHGRVPDGVAGGKRAIPDIGLMADAYTGMAVGATLESAGGYVEYSGGGTSLASPLLAGLVANAAQAQDRDRFGFLNGALYSLSGSPAIADVTPVQAGMWTPSMVSYGHVTVPQEPGSYLVDVDARPQSLQSGPGWDPVTGIGSPTGRFLTDLGR